MTTRNMFKAIAGAAAGVVLLGSVAFGQANTNDSLIVTNSASPQGSRTLKFGVNTGATLGIDNALGEQSFPPFPPSSVFEARFVPINSALAGTEGSPNDFRPSTSSSQRDTFKIKFQPGTGGSPVNINWSSSAIAAHYGSATLTDAITGTLVNVNMRTTGSVSITNAAITELIMITGSPVAPPQGLGVSGCPLDFGIVSIPTPGTGMRSLVLTNQGVGTVTIDSIRSSNPDFVVSSPASFPQTISSSPLNVNVNYTYNAASPVPSTGTLTIYFDGNKTESCSMSANPSSGEGLFFTSTLDTTGDNSTGHMKKIGLKYSGSTPAQGVQFELHSVGNLKRITRVTLGSGIATPSNYTFDYEIDYAASGADVKIVLYGNDTTKTLPAFTDDMFRVYFDVANIKLCNSGLGGDDTTAVMYMSNVQSALATNLGQSAGIGVDPNRDSSICFIFNTSARGDLNCDDKVNILDVLILNDAILGRTTLAPWQVNRADLAPWNTSLWNSGAAFNDNTNYGDGTLNVQDLVLLKNAILNEQWPDGDMLMKIEMRDGGRGAASSEAFNKGAAAYDVKFLYEVSNSGIKVDMNNLVPVKGYQMKMKAQDAPKDLFVNFNSAINTPFVIDYAVINGEIRMLAYSKNGEPIAPMNGNLMEIPFAVSNPDMVVVIEPITVGGANNDDLKVEYSVVSKVSGVTEAPVTGALALENLPNPFNGNTTIHYTLPKNDVVTLVVTDASGKVVTRLIDGVEKAAGQHSIEFDAAGLSNGTYFYTLTAGSLSTTSRMVLAR